MSSFDVKVKIGRVDALMRKLQNLQGFRTGTKTAFVHLKSKIAKYPPRSSRPQAQYWTKKQRQGFFYHLKKGDIEVPYRRGTSPNSERLGQRWIIEGEGFGLTLHNRAGYASRVQGSQQTEYHKRTGWKQADTVVREELPTMRRIVLQEVTKDLAK